MKEKTGLPEWCLILKELEEEAKREIIVPSARAEKEEGDQAGSTTSAKSFFFRIDAQKRM